MGFRCVVHTIRVHFIYNMRASLWLFHLMVHIIYKSSWSKASHVMSCTHYGNDKGRVCQPYIYLLAYKINYFEMSWVWGINPPSCTYFPIVLDRVTIILIALSPLNYNSFQLKPTCYYLLIISSYLCQIYPLISLNEKCYMRLANASDSFLHD